MHALARSLAKDRLAHAYLFTGPHAIGKTTLARALAQTLECPDTARPCGECIACKKIARDRHPDVQIIEGVPVGFKFDEKSPPPPPRANDWERRIIKIDQIRLLQHDISRAPFESPWRVIIVRRFEEANEEAANAFLKTLEEPPAHTRIILTARDASLLLPTIPSRCQVLALRPLAPAQIQTALRERWGVAAETARVLAHLAGGRLGWAIRASENPRLLEARHAHLAALHATLTEGHNEKILRAETLAKKDDDLPEMIEWWLSWWRDVLLTQHGDAARVSNIDFEDTLRAHAARFTLEQIQDALQAIRQTARQLAQNINPRLALEVLLLKLPA